MTLTIRDGAKGVTVRATGADAHRLRAAIASAIDPECTQEAREALPNAPKGNFRGTGAPLALRIATATASRRAR